MITRVILLGFQGIHLLRFCLFNTFLIIYCLTIFGNLLIITLVTYNKSLHTPMYFFLTQLSTSDILLSTDIVPNMLSTLLYNSTTLTISNFMSQFYIFMLTNCFDCFLLTVMSYDRYVAICNPLLYHTVINQVFCIKLVLLSWLLSICATLMELITVYNLWFCGPNIIDHFFCDMEPLLEISCSATYIVQTELTVLSIPVLIFPFSFIIITYCFIICNILKIPSRFGRKKAFSTCSSHLIVVSVFYGTLFFIYILPRRRQAWNLSKVVSLLYTVVTPLLNPMVYSLRNKDIKAALNNTLHRMYSALFFLH